MVSNKLVEFWVENFLQLLITCFRELHEMEEMIFVKDFQTIVGKDLQLLFVLIQDYLDVLVFWVLDPDKVQGKIKFLAGKVGLLR